MTCQCDARTRRRSAGCTRQGGFTLIEVLVAFGILSLTLVALLQVFSQGLRSVDVAERHLIATMLMRSILDDLGTEIPIVVGERSGDIDDGYRWTTRIARSRTVAPIATGQWTYFSYEIEVEIAWNDRPVTTATTLRIGAEPAAPFAGNDAEEGALDEEPN